MKKQVPKGDLETNTKSQNTVLSSAFCAAVASCGVGVLPPLTHMGEAGGTCPGLLVTNLHTHAHTHLHPFLLQHFLSLPAEKLTLRESKGTRTEMKGGRGVFPW